MEILKSNHLFTCTECPPCLGLKGVEYLASRESAFSQFSIKRGTKINVQLELIAKKGYEPKQAMIQNITEHFPTMLTYDELQQRSRPSHQPKQLEERVSHLEIGRCQSQRKAHAGLSTKEKGKKEKLRQGGGGGDGECCVSESSTAA